jgi:hypothetical protein
MSAPQPGAAVYQQTSSASQYPEAAAPESNPAYSQPELVQPSRPSAPQGGATISYASYSSFSSSASPAMTKAQFDSLRPGVQNVIRALRAMPPGARAQQLGSYGDLTLEEMELVWSAVSTRP